MNKCMLSFMGLLNLALTVQIFGAAEPIPPAVRNNKIYVKNSSPYRVHISVGPQYPSAIALCPGQIIEFPTECIPVLMATNYGKLAYHLTFDVAKLDVLGFFKDHSECMTNDCIIEITYENTSSGFWVLASYLFGLGAWKIAPPRLLEAEKDLAGYFCNEDVPAALFSVVVNSSDSISEDMARDSALIWSMFPRAAAKIEANKSIRPYNTLGLDVGGLIASADQLRNWGALLNTVLRKKYATVKNHDIWEAVYRVIADATEAIISNNYVSRSPGYCATLLDIGKKSEVLKVSDFPSDLIGQLQERVKCDEIAAGLVKQLEQATRELVLRNRQVNDVQGVSMPPAPPAPPAPSPASACSFQEKEVKTFEQEIKEKLPEEQTLFDKVISEIFRKIDILALEQNNAIRLKYVSLDKLRMFDCDPLSVKKLSRVNEFMTMTMIKLAQEDKNPGRALQDWLTFIANSDRQKAYKLSRMDEQSLQNEMQADRRSPNVKINLVLLLQAQFQKFQKH